MVAQWKLRACVTAGVLGQSRAGKSTYKPPRTATYLTIALSAAASKFSPGLFKAGGCKSHTLSVALPADNTPLRSSLVAEANVVELFRDEPDEELGLRIVGGKDTPLGNIVIQEIVRDSLAARDGRLAPGDHILEVRGRAQSYEEQGTVIFLHQHSVTGLGCFSKQ